MTALAYLARPEDESRAAIVLLTNWTRAVTPDVKTGKHVSFKDLVSEEDHAKVENWLATLNAKQALRIWGLHDRFYKKPLARDPDEWDGLYQIWYEAQLAMAVVARGDSPHTTEPKTRQLPEDMATLLTDEELDDLYPQE